MIIDTRFASAINFEKSWLPWITLRHFLPASSIRSLCATMVHEMSGGRISIEELVDERLGSGSAFMETWLIRPKVCSTQLARHLQRYVQKIVWKNDEETWEINDSIEKEAALSPSALQFAFNLGSGDLLHIVEPLPENMYVQSELKALYDAVSLCSYCSDISDTSEIDDLLKNIDSILTNVSPELRVVTLKHLGDLFCDRDRWGIAKKLYEHAESALEKYAELELVGDFISAIKTSIHQSLAASAAVTNGHVVGQRMLDVLLNSPVGEEITVLANAGFDEYVLRVNSSESIFQDDTRSAALIAPLLAESLTNENAFASWRAEEFSKAEVWFWSTLRRQTSLGLFAASKVTKGHYGACLVEDLMLRKSYDKTTFKLAIGLLIESESSEQTKKIRWSDELLDACVDGALCQFVIDHAEAYEGSRQYRRTVAVVLFKEWASNIGAGQDALVAQMLHYLISIGSNLNSDFRKNGADFQICFEAVLNVCKLRPEFRMAIRDELANVLALRIGNAGFWTGEDIALQLATECAPVFTVEKLKDVVTATVTLLKKTNPSDGNWVIVKPAVKLLSQECVGSLAELDGELGSAIIKEILKFNAGDSNGAYAADIIFALNRYPASLLRVQDVESQYTSLIQQALDKASTISASNAVNNMMALLVAPRAAGQEAIAKVLEILSKIFETTANGKSSLSFGPAYAPVRYLVAYHADICRESTMPEDEFDRSLAQLYEKLQMIWHIAIENPAIFAPLALLREKPAELAIVHNWALASLELAKHLGQSEAMENALEAAKNQTQLSDGISLGFATRHAGGGRSDVDVECMLTESRWAFYAAIGRRLSALQSSKDRNFKVALLKNTLRHGPRSVDAAIFASIFPHEIEHLVSLKQEFADYTARIGENRELSLTLIPLLERWNNALLAQSTQPN